MTQTRKVATDILSYIPITFLPPVINLIGVLVYTRILGPEGFGVYALILATLQGLVIIFQGWISQSVFRFIGKTALGSEDRATHFTTSAVFFGLTLLLEVLIFVPIIYVLGYQQKELWILAGIIFLVAFGIVDILHAILRADLRIVHLTSLLLTFAALPVVLGAIYLAVRGPNPLGLIVVISMCKLLISFVFLLITVPRGGYTFSKGRLWTTARTFLVYGLPVSAMIVGERIISVASRYFLEHYRNLTEVGLYSASYEILFKLLTYAFPFIAGASMPHMVKLFDAGQEKAAKELHSKVLYLLLILLAPATGFVMVNADMINNLFLGEDYSGINHLTLSLIASGSFFYIVATYYFRLLMLAKRTTYLGVSSIFCALFNLIGNWLLIPEYGMLGAAISSTASYLLLTILTYMFARRFFHPLSPNLITIMIFFAVGSLAAWAAKHLFTMIASFDRATDSLVLVMELAVVIAITFALFIIIMQWNPTLRNYQRLLASRLFHRFQKPVKGDDS